MLPMAPTRPSLDPALATAIGSDLQEVVIVAGTDGRVRSVTPSVQRVLGLEAEQLSERNLAAYVHPSERRRFALEFGRVAASAGATGRFSGRIVTGPDRTRAVEVRLVNRVHTPDVEGVVLSVRDATDQTRIMAALHAQARTDALTGLPNRLAFEERLARALATPTESPVALTMLDVDRFKIVNDSLGHRAGDALIREVGVRIRDAVRGTDLLARPNVRLVRGDVRDRAAVASALAGASHIVHMASIAGVDTVMRAPVLTMQVSLQGTMHVLEVAQEMREAGGDVRRVVDFSTSEVFGKFAFNVAESDATALGAVGEARWTYAVAKLATEHLCANYHKQFGLPTASIRPFNIYGPRQVGTGAIHHFVRHALAGSPLVIHNDGAQIRSWCYIDDIVDGILLV